MMASHSIELLIYFLWTLKQLRALSDQFYRTPEHHRFVRQQVVKQVSIVEGSSCISATPELQYAHGFHGQISSQSLVNCRSSLCITSEALQLAWQLESHPEFYAGYVPMDYREYLKKMSKWVFVLLFVYKQMFSLYCKYTSSFLLCSNNPTRSGEWGDHVTLQAAADSVIFMYLEQLLLY